MYVCFSKARAKLVYVHSDKFIITVQIFVRYKKCVMLKVLV